MHVQQHLLCTRKNKTLYHIFKYDPWSYLNIWPIFEYLNIWTVITCLWIWPDSQPVGRRSCCPLLAVVGTGPPDTAGCFQVWCPCGWFCSECEGSRGPARPGEHDNADKNCFSQGPSPHRTPSGPNDASNTMKDTFICQEQQWTRRLLHKKKTLAHQRHYALAVAEVSD